MSPRVAAAALCVLAGCAASAPLRTRPSLLQGAAAPQSYPSPAEWRYHPSMAAPLFARVELSDGRTLLAGQRGERWLLDARSRRVEAAARLAPEDLIAILSQGDGHFAFVAQSGTSYEARSPLGAFERQTAPPEPLAQVAAHGSALAGVTSTGALLYGGDVGASWSAAHVEGAPTGFVDVALAAGGRGLALAVPERLVQTSDGGASWKAVAAPSIGAHGLRVTPSGDFVLRSVLGSFLWRPDATPPYERWLRAAPGSLYELAVAPSRGPDAGAIGEGRALITGGRYLEIASVADQARPRTRQPAAASSWVLRSGPVDGDLGSEVVPELSGCKVVRIGAHGRWAFAACWAETPEAGATEAQLYKSEDGGRSWQIDVGPIEAQVAGFKMVVGAGGALNVTGVCAKRAASRGCAPSGVLYRRRHPPDAETAETPKSAAAAKQAGTKGRPAPKRSRAATKKLGHGEKDEEAELELAVAATPSLSGTAVALAVSPDGATTYAVGRRAKSGKLALYLSHDHGRSFEAHDLGDLPVDAPSYGYGYDYDYYDGGYRRPPIGGGVRSLSVGEDGSAAIVLENSSRLVVADERGDLISASPLPADASLVGAVGVRALALAPSARRAWESLDGGASWQTLGQLPLDVCNHDERCDVPIVCHLGGCVVGHELSRVGWHGQSDDDSALLAPDSRPTGVAQRKLRPALACTLDSVPWRALPGLIAAPTAHDAALGSYHWLAPSLDRKKALPGALVAPASGRGKIDSVDLLPASKRPELTAVVALAAGDGIAALRYAVSAGVGVDRLREAEVAWLNAASGRVVRQSVGDLGPSVPNDFAGAPDLARTAFADVARIGARGLYLRPHSAGPRQPTLFLDGRTVTTLPITSWPISGGVRSFDWFARVGDVDVPFLSYGNGVALVRGPASPGAAFDALTTGLDASRLSATSQLAQLTELDGQPAMYVLRYPMDSDAHSALLFPLRASGAVTDAPIPAPSQVELGDRLQRCSPEQRAHSARIVAPYQGGTRRPVLVAEASEPLHVLLTDNAVLFGSATEPCVAVLDATTVAITSDAPPRDEQALLPLDDLEHSFLFRRSSSPDGSGPRRWEVRLMACRVDPTAEIPFELYGAPGATLRKE